MPEGQSGELVRVLSALESETSDQLEVGRCVEHRDAEYACLINDIAGVIAFADRDADAQRLVGLLESGVDDAAVRSAVKLRGRHIQAVADFEESCSVYRSSHPLHFVQMPLRLSS